MPKNRDEEFDALPPGTRSRSAIVIVAAILLVLTIVWLLSGGGAEFFRPKIELHTYLSDSGGLEKDADVLLNGVTVGKVAKVRISQVNDPNRAIQVDLRVERRFIDSIPVDSIAALTADNLLGDKYINITAGKAIQTVTDGSEIASLLQNGSFNPADLVSSLQITLKRIDTIITEIQEGNTPLAQFVNGNDLYTQILAQVETIQKAIQSTAGPKTQIGQMLFSDAFYNQIRQPIVNLDKILEETQRGENSTGKMLNTSAAYDNAVAQIHKVHQSLDDLNAGKGTGGQMLKSDAQYQKLETQIQNINQSIDQITTGNGKFAQLLESRQLYDNLTVKSTTTGTFLREFRQAPQKFLRIKPFGSKTPKKP